MHTFTKYVLWKSICCLTSWLCGSQLDVRVFVLYASVWLLFWRSFGAHLFPVKKFELSGGGPCSFPNDSGWSLNELLILSLVTRSKRPPGSPFPVRASMGDNLLPWNVKRSEFRLHRSFLGDVQKWVLHPKKTPDFLHFAEIKTYPSNKQLKVHNGANRKS